MLPTILMLAVLTSGPEETNRLRWTVVSALLPLAMGFGLCLVVAQVWRLVV